MIGLVQLEPPPPTQSTAHAVARQLTVSEQEDPPVQAMSQRPASHSIGLLQALPPVHATEHVPLWQVIGVLTHELPPEQPIVHVPASQRIAELAHAIKVPSHVTEHDVPLQRIGPPQLLPVPPHSMSHFAAAVQSTPLAQALSPQVTLQGEPGGHTTTLVHALAGQSIAHVPASVHAPPASPHTLSSQW